MKARIVNDTIVEILVAVEGHDIKDCFHPQILATCIDVPEGANVGWLKQEDGTWAAPATEEPAPVVEETPPAE